MPRLACTSFHMFAVKVLPLSVVIILGRPNLCTHPRMKAVEQLAAVASGRGRASNHRVVRSSMVNRYRMDSDGGRGPTMSNCRSLNLVSSTGRFATGGRTVVFVLQD